MDLRTEEELESLKESVIEFKELVDNLLYLLGQRDLSPDIEESISEIRGIAEDLEI